MCLNSAIRTLQETLAVDYSLLYFNVDARKSHECKPQLPPDVGTLFCYAAADPQGTQPPSDARATWSLPVEYERMAARGGLGVAVGDIDAARDLFSW